MTKKHFNQAADIVRAILNGEWTDDPPSWADATAYTSVTALDDSADTAYTRAVQTAEAFIVLFSAHNDRFDINRFLVACGLRVENRKAR